MDTQASELRVRELSGWVIVDVESWGGWNRARGRHGTSVLEGYLEPDLDLNASMPKGASYWLVGSRAVIYVRQAPPVGSLNSNSNRRRGPFLLILLSPCVPLVVVLPGDTERTGD